MFNFQTEEVLIHPRAQLDKQYCQQSRRCGNVYLEVEIPAQVLADRFIVV